MSSIYKKLVSIMSEVDAIEKNMTVGSGNYSYKAISEKEVLNKVKPLLKKYSVLMIPVKIETDTTFTSVVTNEEYKGKVTQKVKNSCFSELIVTYDVVDAETGEKIQCIGIGHGVDAGDKASGKASTYADKNAIIRLFKLFSGEDTDNTNSNDLEQVTQSPAKEEEPQKPWFNEAEFKRMLKGFTDDTVDNAVLIKWMQGYIFNKKMREQILEVDASLKVW